VLDADIRKKWVINITNINDFFRFLPIDSLKRNTQLKNLVENVPLTKRYCNIDITKLKYLANT